MPLGLQIHQLLGIALVEVEEADPTVLASVKDGIAWGEIDFTGTSGFADGTDNEGASGLSSCRIIMERRDGPRTTGIGVWSEYSSGNSVQCSGWIHNGERLDRSNRVCIQCQNS